MTISTRACGALFLTLTAASVQAAPVTPTLTSRSEKFSVWLPGKPQIGSQVANVPGAGKMNVKFYMVRSAPVAYVVIPMKLPGVLPKSQTAQFLDGVQRGFTMSAGAKLISSKPISLQGISGREILVGAGENRMRARVFARGNRSFQIVAISPQSGAGGKSAQMTKVLDSFRILK